jgi:hypothetical protein
MLASQVNPIADDDAVWDHLFHGCTSAALVDLTVAGQRLRAPDATRRQAFA